MKGRSILLLLLIAGMFVLAADWGNSSERMRPADRSAA